MYKVINHNHISLIMTCNFLFRNGTSKMTCLQDQEEFLSNEVNSKQEITFIILYASQLLVGKVCI